jgi:hypothetical protein
LLEQGDDEDSSDKSSRRRNRCQTSFFSSKKRNVTRPSTVSLTQEFYPWEYFDIPDLTPALTKSALIYQLIRSRLEANLAKSILANKDRSTNIYSSTN